MGYEMLSPSAGVRMQPAVWAALVLAMTILPAAESAGQAGQMVPAKHCELITDTAQCFLVSPGSTIQVGQNVVALKNLDRLCMDIDTIQQSGSPVKVVLAIDYSGSMCTTNPANDPTNQRLLAAHLFVDSLARKSPQSQVSVLLFYANRNNITHVVGPLTLSSRANLDSLHHTIYQAKCEARPDPYYPAGLPKLMNPAKVTATYQGIALDSALKVIDRNYTSADSASRHIILLTDDGWTVSDDYTPATVLQRYHAAYPGRRLPMIHAVYLTADGDTSQTADPNLRAITDSTGGMFIRNVSPATVVQRLNDILTVITLSRKESLVAVSITNIGTSTTLNATITPVAGSLNDFKITAPSMDLAFGQNVIVIRKTYRTVSGSTSTSADTLRITRLVQDAGDPAGSLFGLACTVDSFNLTLRCSPAAVDIGAQVSVAAQVSPASRLFTPGQVTATAFSTADPTEPGTEALYHLNGSVSDATGNHPGSGSPSFTATNSAFRTSMNGGSFSTDISPLSGDCAVELWVRRESTGSTGTVLQGQGYTLEILSNGTVRFTAGSATITSASVISTGTWHHVAIARSGATAYLFIDGQQSGQQAATAADLGGTVTISAPAGIMADEIRFSTISRIQSSGSSQVFNIPTAAAITWTVKGTTASGPSVTLPADIWSVGSAQFSFTSAQPCGVIVNLSHAGTDDGTWSVNSNPVQIGLAMVPAVPVTVSLLDTNGNGFLDRMNVVAPDSVVLADPLPALTAFAGSMTLTLHDGAIVQLRPAARDTLDAHSLRITLTENTGTGFETGWQQYAIQFLPVAMTANEQPFTAGVVLDSAGPVVVRAYYASNIAPSARQGTGDTLSIMLSEPVSWKRSGISTPADAFVYYRLTVDSTGSAFAGLPAANIKPSTTNNRQVFVIIDNGFAVIPPNDSIRLRPGLFDVADQAGNAPQYNGRKAVIEWPPYNKVEMAAGPNPFVIGQDLPPGIKTFYANVLAPVTGSTGRVPGGTVIGIQSRIPLKRQTADGSYGRSQVYDAVGNTVAKDLAVRQAGTYRDYGVYWDGRNTNGRYVGNGTYLMVTTVTDEKDAKVVQRIKIAVRR